MFTATRKGASTILEGEIAFQIGEERVVATVGMYADIPVEKDDSNLAAKHPRPIRPPHGTEESPVPLGALRLTAPKFRGPRPSDNCQNAARFTLRRQNPPVRIMDGYFEDCGCESFDVLELTWKERLIELGLRHPIPHVERLAVHEIAAVTEKLKRQGRAHQQQTMQAKHHCSSE